MRRVTCSWALIAACSMMALALPSGCGPGNSGNNNGDEGATVSGRVVDAADPSQGIANAYVYMAPRGALRQDDTIGTTADANGDYSLTDVPTGAYSIVVVPPEGSGYRPVEVFADISSAEPVTVRLTNATGDVAETIAAMVISPSQVDLAPGGSQVFVATVTDAEGNALSLAPTWIVTGGIGTIDSQGHFTAGDSPGAGMVVATLSGHVAAARVSVGGTPSNRPPKLSPLVPAPAPPIAPGQAVTIQASASDPDGDDLFFAWFAAGAATVGTGATISWTAPTTPGVYIVTCAVLDTNGGVASRSISLPVGVENRPPTLTGIEASPGLQVGLGAHVSLTAAAVDADGDPLTFVWLGPDGTIVGTGTTLGLTMPTTSAQVVYTCVVRDPSGGSDNQTATIEVMGDTNAGTGRRIAWVNASVDRADILVGWANGSGTPVTITHGSAANAFPALSAGNSVVAWASRESSGDWEVYVAPADGSGAPANISQDSANDDVAPSIDASGTTVVWLKGAPVDVYAAPADGTGTPRDLSNTPDVDSWDPSISGDGSKVAWAEGSDLVVASSADGGGLVNVTAGADLGVSDPALNYDATVVVWEHGQQIFVADVADGATPTRVDAGTGAINPSISDDGESVAWIGLGAGNAASAYAAVVGGEGPAELARFARGDVDPTICLSPEGDIAAWDAADSTGSSYDVFVGNADGTGVPMNLTEDGLSGSPSLQGN